MKIEFFHDVICSFCFPMSYRMRQLKKEMPELEIIHRSFALVKKPTDFDLMFGSREEAKKEIMHHWEQANRNDDLHRFNITGMKQQDFLFPSSMNGLLAVKAAETLGGSEAYWDLFDGLQTALFVENQNIEELKVIEEVVQKLNLDLSAWRSAFQSEETLVKVKEDLQRVDNYGIKGAPSLVINEKYEISGAQSLETIKQTLATIKEKEQVVLKPVGETNEGGSCRVENGQYICD